MEDKKFKIRSYGWTELALCYNPGLQPASAARLLRRWVQKSKELQSRLKAAGYLKGQRILTPRQVEIIIDIIGDP